MKLPPDTMIAGRRTIKDWEKLKIVLADFGNLPAWTIAYQDYFLTRLTDRYLDPIETIKNNGEYRGEGFSIMTIICSLIEFLETTYLGLSYKYAKTATLSKYEYNNSIKIFISFLSQRNPFRLYFDKTLAEEFYKNIRCGLLHEARTKGKWTIWGMAGSNKLVERKTHEVIVYRDNFYEGLKTFITAYKNDLLQSFERKEAFIRKFNSLCE